jgi:hypothetical protein
MFNQCKMDLSFIEWAMWKKSTPVVFFFDCSKKSYFGSKLSENSRFMAASTKTHFYVVKSRIFIKS